MSEQDKILCINRPIYSQSKFDDEFKLDKNSAKTKSRFIKETFKCLNPKNLLGIFIILNLLTEYNFKKNLISDILSGLTVGVMHIPAALAYGALTSLNPVHGLYTSFYTGLTYVLFGTSKHLSVGTFAVTSLMVYSTINRIESEYPELIFNNSKFNFTNNETIILSSNQIESNTMQLKIKVATCLAFWCGIFQILFSIMKLGNISKYLSQPLLRGFTTAAAFHVFTTQLRHILGIYYVNRKRRKFFKLIFVYLNSLNSFLAKNNIKSINWAAFIFSCIAILFLILTRTQINERFKKQLRNIPLPIELFVIITGTVVTYYAKLDTKYNMAIVGDIPKGLPEPSLPEFSLFFDVFLDAIIISIIAFATSLSVSDLYARKHKYKIDSNKEFFALGMANFVGSFFKCFVSCGALARTVVLESSGGKTQLVTIIASGIVLTVMLWFAPLLATLPKACLGSIIIAALINLLKQIKDIPYYWKLDKLDFLAWIITFTSTILFDVDIGLCVGIITVLFLNTHRNQTMHVAILGKIKDYEIYSDLENYSALEYEKIKIVSPTHSIFYINSDIFRAKLNALCPLTDSMEPLGLYENCKINYNCFCKSNKNDLEKTADAETQNLKIENNKKFNTIILDLKNAQFIDEAGVKCLNEIVKEYNKDHVKILMANCNQIVVEFFKKMKCKFDEIIYLTVQDAILSCLRGEI